MPVSSTSTLVGFPDAQSTGVRDGVTLSQVGDMTVTTPGAVISGLEIHGRLTILADNVTVRDCKIVNTGDYMGIFIPDGNTGAVVEYCDIIGATNGISGTGTFGFNDISQVDNGVNVYGPSLIVDNYIHDLSGGPDAHYDGIEINGGGGTTIRHNTIINDHSQTSAVMINNDFGAVPGIVIDNNYLAGGGYTIYSDGGFSSTDLITGVQITNNFLGQGYWGYYAFMDNTPLVSGNHELGRTWPTPVSDGSTLPPGPTPPPEPTPMTLSLAPSSDSGVLGDGITNDNTPTLTGNVAANSNVTVFERTTQIGTVTADASGAWRYTTDTLADGDHSFTATATSGGTTRSSSALSVTVDTRAPSAPTISSLFSTDTGTVGDGITSDNTLTLTGAARALADVTVYDGKTLLGQTTANSSGVWSYTTGPLSNGPHSFTASRMDTAGNEAASAALAVTVNTVGTPPSTGTSGDNVLQGTIGADILTGGAGNDTYTVNHTGDKVVELANQGTDKVESTISYTLADNVENLQLMGGAGINGTGNGLNNTIIGNDVSNTLKGGAGDDTLNGWGGKDTLVGDSGNDVFQFSSQFSADGDTVADFIPGVDILDFSKIDAGAAFIFDGYTNGGSNGHLWASFEDQGAGVTHVYGKTGDFQFHIDVHIIDDVQGTSVGLTASDFRL